MKSNIKILPQIKVGFQKRDDTYSGKLAFVVGVEKSGKVRKETSWNNWRDKKITDETFDNVPTSGFVLNKKVGGERYSYNPRLTYVRVYDPRGFEFEIQIPNLIYILENTNSIKGKGLEGEFVYGWDGAQLLLIPTSSPEYSDIVDFNVMMDAPERIKEKDLVFGGVYRDNTNQDLIYLGKFPQYRYYYDGCTSNGTNQGDRYWFRIVNPESHNYQPGTIYTTSNDYALFKNIYKKIVKTVSADPVGNYAELMEALEHLPEYSPVDPSKHEYVPANFEKVKEFFSQDGRWYKNVFTNDGKKLVISRSCDQKSPDEAIFFLRDERHVTFLKLVTLREIFDQYNPHRRIMYLKNGKKCGIHGED